MSSTITQTVPTQPDIQYAPDREKYEARTKLRLANEALPKDLPPGFPEKLTGDLVWEGNDLADKYNWIYELGPTELAEVEAALQHFKSLNLPLGHISPQTFPLSATFHNNLRSITHELHHGHGFKVLRGLPITAHDRLDNITIYAGLSSHIAPLRARQDTTVDGDGNRSDVVLNHIKDLSTSSVRGTIGAPAYTADKQVFHTDSGDIVSLFALSVAATGGVSRLASTWRVYNELAATRPDLIHTLSSDFVFENFDRGATNQTKEKEGGGSGTSGTSGDKSNVGSERYTKRPLLYHQAATTTRPERVILQYARRYFTGFGALPRSRDIPAITEAQAEALDALHFLGERFNVGLDFRPGDVQYVNNLAVFHARDRFTDTRDRQRHLVRLWLRDPEHAWETPLPLREKWARLYADVRPETQVFPLEPSVRGESRGGGGSGDRGGEGRGDRSK